MAIDTFTIKFNEYELETILAALDDYRHYDDRGHGSRRSKQEEHAIDDKIDAQQSKIRSLMPLQTNRH